MATSGTATFNLDINEIIEEAYERAGLGRAFSGNDFGQQDVLSTCCHRILPIGALTFGQSKSQPCPFQRGTATHALPADTVSILDHSIRTGTGNISSDLTINRMSVGEYAGITNKNTRGRPVKVYIERLRDNPKLRYGPFPMWRLTHWCTTGFAGFTTPRLALTISMTPRQGSFQPLYQVWLISWP